jgi:hypothetical protein
MFRAMKTDNVAVQLIGKCMTKAGIQQGKIQTLMGFKQNRRPASSQFLKMAYFSSSPSTLKY